jgi:hypothetical protein
VRAVEKGEAFMPALREGTRYGSTIVRVRVGGRVVKVIDGCIDVCNGRA